MSPKPRRLAVDVYGYGQVARALLPMLKRAEIGIATVRDRTRIRISHPARGGRRVFVDGQAGLGIAIDRSGRLEVEIDGRRQLVESGEVQFER